MKRLACIATLVAAVAVAALAAEGISGTWVAGSGSSAQTFIFRVQRDTFIGVVCGPCDDPATVFRITDGRIVDAQRATFYVVHDDGGPLFKQYGPYRDRVTATFVCRSIDAGDPTRRRNRTSRDDDVEARRGEPNRIAVASASARPADYPTTEERT